MSGDGADIVRCDKNEVIILQCDNSVRKLPMRRQRMITYMDSDNCWTCIEHSGICFLLTVLITESTRTIRLRLNDGKLHDVMGVGLCTAMNRRCVRTCLKEPHSGG